MNDYKPENKFKFIYAWYFNVPMNNNKYRSYWYTAQNWCYNHFGIFELKKLNATVETPNKKTLRQIHGNK